MAVNEQISPTREPRTSEDYAKGFEKKMLYVYVVILSNGRMFVYTQREVTKNPKDRYRR